MFKSKCKFIPFKTRKIMTKKKKNDMTVVVFSSILYILKNNPISGKGDNVAHLASVKSIELKFFKSA